MAKLGPMQGFGDRTDYSSKWLKNRQLLYYANPAPRIRNSCSFPFPAVEVGRRLQRQIVLLYINQQPTVGRLVADIDNRALQHQTAWQNRLDGVGFLARKDEFGIADSGEMSLYDCNEVRANSDVSSSGQTIDCRQFL